MDLGEKKNLLDYFSGFSACQSWFASNMTRAKTGSKVALIYLDQRNSSAAFSMTVPFSRSHAEAASTFESLRVFLQKTAMMSHGEPGAVVTAPPSSLASRLRRSAEPSSPLRPEVFSLWSPPKVFTPPPMNWHCHGHLQGTFPCDSVPITHTSASTFTKA